MYKHIPALLLLSVLISCNNHQDKKATKTSHPVIGRIERLDPALDAILSHEAKAEIIADSCIWSEGPLWIEKENMLLFSDVPTNTLFKWTEANGKEIYLKPSGYTDSAPSVCKEPGSNGVLLDEQGILVLCQHGDRRMAKMNAPLSAPSPKFISLAGSYQGKRFSSPNDAACNKEGEIFFTDPPYGLSTQDDNAPEKELPWNGVYKIRKDGRVILLVDSISRPNGIAFFPGGKNLIVACSDPVKPNWYVFDVAGDSLINGRIFYSAAGYDKKLQGLPDGLKIDKNGNVFATGPGGLYVFNSEGTLLGKLLLENPASNCALSPDQKTLYITNDMYVLRFRMRN